VTSGCVTMLLSRVAEEAAVDELHLVIVRSFTDVGREAETSPNSELSSTWQGVEGTEGRGVARSGL